jgi:hypothetical protein
MTGVSRRSFAEALALAALAPVLNVGPGSISLSWWISPTSDPTLAPPGQLARALTDVIRAQYGRRLSPKDLKRIAQQIQAGLERVDRLRKVELTNGDEPDFVFTAGLPQARRHG